LTRGLKRIGRRAGRPVALAAILAILAAGLWHFALGGLLNGGGSPSDSVALATDSPQLIYSEFGQNSDTIWAAAADDLSRRRAIATVAHTPEYGIFPSLSPDGGRIAYTVLPADGGLADIAAPAEVWVMDGNGAGRRRLAVNADLPVTPVWAPDGGSLVFRGSVLRENAAGSFQLVRTTLAGEETVLVAADVGLFPVGFSPDGATFYYVQLSPSGSDLGRVAATGGPAAPVAHLSDDFARDWHLSPDGTRLAYLAPRYAGDRVSYSATVLDLTGNSGGPLLSAASASAAPSAADEFNPIWSPDGRDLTVGRLTSGSAAAPVLQMSAAGAGAERSLAAPPRGFDVPLAWSADGGYLAVRFFEGNSVTNPGRSWVMVVGGSQRQTVAATSDIDVLGWRDGGG
jgi:Tol biopolymer transport system component